MSKPIAEVHSGQLRWLVPEDERPANAKLYATPVRTKDLTDEEILEASVNTPPGFDYFMSVCRAVIAADKEKNKCL